MAYLPESEQDRQRREQQASGGAQQSLSGQSGVISGAPQSATPATGAAKGPSRSGAFTNLNAYISANKPQADQLGQKVGQNIQNAGNEARTNITNATNTFNQKAEQGSISNIGTAKQDANNIVQAAKVTNVGQGLQAQQKNRFSEVGNAQYQGPRDLDEAGVYQPAMQTTKKATDYSKMSENDSGRFTLLQEMMGKPTYSRGQTRLDNLLLGGSDAGKQHLEQARTSVADLPQTLETAATGARQVGQEKIAAHDDVRNYAQDTLVNNRTERATQVDQRVGGVKGQWSDEYNQMADTLSKYGDGNLELTKDQAAKLAVDQNTGLFNMLNDVDPRAYLKQNDFDANKVVSKDEYAQLSALDELASGVGLDETNKYGGADLAGTQTLADSFDGSRFGAEAKSRQELFNQYAKDTRGQASEVVTGIGNFNRVNAGFSQSVEDFLAGRGLTAINNQSQFVMNESMDSRKRVNQRIYDQIQASLNSQGYKNRVQVKE